MVLLYRAWRENSNGFNASHKFAPQAAIWKGKRVKDSMRLSEYQAKQWGDIPLVTLQDALDGIHVVANPFVFFTPSLLFVLCMANYKKKPDQMVYITCIDSDKIKNIQGKPVEFVNATSMLATYPPNGWKHGRRDYTDVVITLDCVDVESGFYSITTLKELETAGLRELYPKMPKIVDWFDTGLGEHRGMGRTSDNDLTPRKIEVVAKVAATIGQLGAGSDDSYVELILWVLALQKRTDTALLRTWLLRDSKTRELLNKLSQDKVGRVNCNIASATEAGQQKEMVQFREMFDELADRSKDSEAQALMNEPAPFGYCAELHRDQLARRPEVYPRPIQRPFKCYEDHCSGKKYKTGSGYCKHLEKVHSMSYTLASTKVASYWSDAEETNDLVMEEREED